MINQKEVWNTIADSWTNLRTKPDVNVVEFAKVVDKGSVLDIGCGNCRNLLPFLEKNLKCFGIDFSKKMIKEAKKYLKKRKFHANLVIGNACFLPFKDNIFDNLIFIRTLGSIQTKEMRLKSLKEIKRVGGKCLITTWYKWRLKIWKKRDFKHFLNLVKNKFSSDLFVDWNYHGKIYKRFYHLYTKSELEEELKILGFNIKKAWKDKEGNVCFVVK